MEIPVRGGSCYGVEGSAVLWSLWSPLESLASAVGTRGSTCKLFELVFEGTWCPDPGTQWLVLWCGGVRGPLERLESFGVLGLCAHG